MEVTAFDLAQRFVGIKEVDGQASNPQILAMLQLDVPWPESDDVPWCAAFVNYVCWLLRLPRSKSLRARSWLDVGESIDIHEAKVGYDVVILQRGAPPAGHVGFYAGELYSPAFGSSTPRIQVLGGNQGNQVSVAPFLVSHVLGVRRLYTL